MIKLVYIYHVWAIIKIKMKICADNKTAQFNLKKGRKKKARAFTLAFFKIYLRVRTKLF